MATLDPRAPFGATLLAAGRGVVAAFCILAFGFLLNSTADREVDGSARKNPLILPGARAQGPALGALLGACGGLAVASPWPARLAILACVALGVAYSVGPRVKSMPIAGSLANVAGFTLLLFVGMQNARVPFDFGYLAAAFAALLLQNQLIHEAADHVEDARAGIRTTWLTLGPRWTAVIAALSGFGAALAGVRIMAPLEWARATWVPTASTLFGLAFPLLLAWQRPAPNSAARLRLAHRWCAVAFGAGLFVAYAGR